MRYNNGSVHTEYLPLGFCISQIGSLNLCFLENYGYSEVNFCVKMTARTFSTIHLSMDQFIELDFTIFSSFLKEGCYFGSICGWISGGFGPNGGLGSEDSVEKVSWKVYAKQKMFTQNPKIIFYHIFACVRAEEEKLKLMLQLDEVQLRLKSVEFRKPVTKRIQHKSHDTSWFHLIILENKSLRITQSFKTKWR